MTIVGAGLVRKLPSASRMASTNGTRPVSEVGVTQARPASGDPGGTSISLRRNSRPLLVHDHVEELRDVGLQSHGCDAFAADELGVHHPVGTGLVELGLGRLQLGAGHDEQRWVGGPGREGHVQVVGVAVGGGDEGRAVATPAASSASSSVPSPRMW